MYQNINPLAKSTAFAEILLMLTIAFFLGYFLHYLICERKHKQTKVGKTLSTKDDLKVLEGIGPAIEKILNNQNIHTYGQLAETKVEVLKDILKKAGPVYENHGEETWAEQATLLRDGKMKEFEKLTSELVGGNRVK